MNRQDQNKIEEKALREKRKAILKKLERRTALGSAF